MKDVAKIYSDRCLGLRLNRIERFVSRWFDRELGKAGLNIHQLSLLSAIARMPGATPGRISQTLDLEKSSLSRNLEVLERESWIHPRRGPSGRILHVSLSRSGQKVLEKAYPHWERVQRRLESLFDRETLNSIEKGIAEQRVP